MRRKITPEVSEVFVIRAHFYAIEDVSFMSIFFAKVLETLFEILYNGQIMGTRCFAMLKPGVLNRRLVGEVISRLEKKGLKLVGLKMMNVSQELASLHYAEHKEKAFYGELVDYITSGPVVAMCLQGDDCISIVRKLVGSTRPSEAAPGTIRGDFCLHTQCNIIHASDSDESAEREINLFFKQEELIDWEDNSSVWY